jgi:hypothetical protein
VEATQEAAVAVVNEDPCPQTTLEGWTEGITTSLPRLQLLFLLHLFLSTVNLPEMIGEGEGEHTPTLRPVMFAWLMAFVSSLSHRGPVALAIDANSVTRDKFPW